MTNHYEQVIVEIPNFQKRAAESVVVYKAWYPAFGKAYSTLWDSGNERYKTD